MGFKNLILLAIFSISHLGHAANEGLESRALKELRSSPTLYGSTLASVEKFAKENGDLVLAGASIHRLDEHALEDGIRILSLTYRPASVVARPEEAFRLGRFPEIHVSVYFHLPTNFEETFGRGQLKFYKIEVVDTVVNLGRQPSPSITGHN